MNLTTIPMASAIVVAFCLSLAAQQDGPAPPVPATITVHANNVAGRLDPRLFGEFSEIIFNSMDGILGAEKLRSRGFENPDANNDGVSDPWVPAVLEGGRATFAVDANVALAQFPDYPSHSQRIEVHQPGLVAIVQTRVPLSQGEVLAISLWLRQEGLTGPVTVALANAKELPPYTTHDFRNITGEWAKYACELTAPKDDPEAEFGILVRGTGTVWIDQVSVMPNDNVHGFKAKVRDLFKELAPATCRIPGGNFAQHYHWTDGIGPRDFRPAVPNYSWNNYMEPNNIGTDEMLRFWKDEIGAEPIICINIGDTDGKNPKPNNSTERNLRDAVNWLEYCNGPTNTEWGRKRAENGHPEPYNVKLWEIGNEIGYGHITGQLDAPTYAQRIIQFANALKAKDPQIEIIVSGLSFNNQWNLQLIQDAGQWIDYIALHTYYGVPDLRDLGGQPLRFEANMRRLYDSWRKISPPGKDIRIAFNEWCLSGQGTRPNAVDAAVYTTAMLHAFMRLHDAVAMQAVTDAWIHVRVQGNQVWTSPTYEAMKLQYRHHGDEVLATDVTCPTYDAPTQGKAIPLLDVVATRTKDRLYVSVLNKGPDPLTAHLHIDGAELGEGAAFALAAPSLDARNLLPTPQAIIVKPTDPPPAASDFDRTFPAYSATVLEMPLR